MPIKPADCPRTSSDNPNNTPMPVLPIANPNYATSSPMVTDSKGREWSRTGLCFRCDAAIYGLHTFAQRYAHEIDPGTPLHHAVPKETTPLHTQPCHCGNPNAGWHGDPHGRREYLCDDCALVSATLKPIRKISELNGEEPKPGETLLIG